ncbi:MAG: DUF2235 domain-containing protein [candidate division NC10 bacterium]|nr:DUF2235 domain-containing protein [candidate division NC10 bacterium]MDE2320699.1 DUF2235 domain-containing protein [candidate division NC10 bacterium]
MRKNIVFCADGTWNNPNEDENADRSPDPTNVYKLFSCLNGVLAAGSPLAADEQEKELVEAAITQQTAKYIHGVGDSRNAIIKLMGGTFGAGVICRVVRGYTFISRNYEPGANIYIIGFSRGAYTARALAGLIASQGLLAAHITQDKELAYRRGAEAWYRYRKATLSNPFSLAHLAEIAANLPAFLLYSSPKEQDLIPVDRIAVVAVWETVGAMGFPEYVAKGKRVDAFKFADTKLSQKVSHGFHAVALDERRNDFTPTLWDAAPTVTQVLFPGAHADVGGGYPRTDDESGLSDIALKWMIDRLGEVGVRFTDGLTYPIRPNPAGTAHKPWAHLPWNLPGVSLGARSFPAGMAQDPSVAERMAIDSVVSDPNESSAPYRPANLP